jgi:hypothetical protein
MLAAYPVNRLTVSIPYHSLRSKRAAQQANRQGVNFGRLPGSGGQKWRRALSSLLPLSRRGGTNEKASSQRSDELGATLRI